MEDTIKIRKDKIKNVAIVFLSIMLVLTFFSNSILNRALPEVATEYVRYDTITERVRGNGVVEADDPYKVVVEDTRTISSVAVSVGDVVSKDQVLFYLEDKESEELKEKEQEVQAKEDELDKAILSYMTAILSVDISNAAFFNIEGDNIASLGAYQAQIEASRQKVQNAQNTVDSLKRQQLVVNMEPSSDIEQEKQLAAAEAAYESAKNHLASVQAQVEQARAAIVSIDQYAGASDTNGDGFGDDTEAKLDALRAERESARGTKETSYTSASAALIAALEAEHPDANPEVGSYFDNNMLKNDSDLSTVQSLVTDSSRDEYEAFIAAYDAYNQASNGLKDVESKITQYAEEKTKWNVANSSLATAQSERDTYKKKVSNLRDDVEEDAEEQLQQKNNLTLSLSDAEKALADAQKEQEQLLKDISSELALSSQNDDIKDTEEELEELREELEELRAKSTGSTIVAPVDGTIISVDRVAGETTMPQEAVATIQVAGKGMKVSFSVTNAQAAKVKVGDKAELQNAWYYSDVMITLDKIKPDKDDPGKKKLLEFVVEGSVADGESLSLSVGERSAEYEHVVPNSAIREDNNGKFIFIIEEKSTPFGNRYKAKRVDVEVLASDEINTAVQADLQGYEYVITTSNQPVEAGDQVRLNS